MAKAKKTETKPDVKSEVKTVPAASAQSKAQSAAPAKPAGKSAKTSAGAKKPAAKQAASPASQPASPMIDTSLAAESAARMLRARAAGTMDQAAPSSGKESSVFKQMKEAMAHPHKAGMDQFLNSSASPASKKANAPFGGPKQVGHNQTFGADVNRHNVPRRTGGG